MKEMIDEYYPKEDIEEANLIPRPKFSWEKGTFTLWDVNNKIPLPAVVQCDTKSCPVPVDRSRFNFDLTQPLLLHRNRVIRKIPARSLYVDKVTQTYKEIGDPLLIPEDYKGWFSILKKNCKGTLEDSVPHYTKIEEIAKSDTEEFLIGGDKYIQTFQILDNNNGNPIQQQRQMFPGDVLRKGKIFTGETKRKSKILRKGKTVSEKFLLCTDDSDREVLIPFTQTGKFYSLTISAEKRSRPVMQMNTIVSSKLLPCVVKLVYGRVPNTPCSFTGLLHLDKDNLEQSVVAATLLNCKNILLEIPILCNLRFRVAEIDKEVVSNKGYKNALSLCAEKAQTYMRNIKVCHTLEQEPDPPSQCQSTYKDKEDTDVPPPTAHMASSSKNLSISSYTSSSTDKSGDRDSGYIKMDSPYLELLEDDEQVLYEEPQNTDNSQDDYCPMNSSSYLFKIFLENRYMTVPMYDRPVNESDTDGDQITENEYSTEVSDMGCHASTPPLLPPPPVPCAGPPPAPCSGSQDSGLSEVSHSGMRRPSTVTFYEGSAQEIIYAAPKVPSRRVSAPPGYDIIPDEKPKSRADKYRRCNRRGSQITFYEGCNNTTKETNRSIKRRMSENVLPECDRMSTTSGSSTEMILELDDCDEDEFPLYENIAGLKEITDTIGRLRRESCTNQNPDNSSEECEVWKQKPLDPQSLENNSTDSSSSGIHSPSNKSSSLHECYNDNTNFYFTYDKTEVQESTESTAKDEVASNTSDISFSSSEELQNTGTKANELPDNAIFKRISYFADDEIDVETPENDETGDNKNLLLSNTKPCQIAYENATYTGISEATVEPPKTNQNDNICKTMSDVLSETFPSGQQLKMLNNDCMEYSKSTDDLNDRLTPTKQDVDEINGNENLKSDPSPCSISNPSYGVQISSGNDTERADDVEKTVIKTDSTDKKNNNHSNVRKIPPKPMEKTYTKLQYKIQEFQNDDNLNKTFGNEQVVPPIRRGSDSSYSTKNSYGCTSPKLEVKSHHHSKIENKVSKLSEMSVSQLSDALKHIGLKQGTVDKIKENNIDGQSLSNFQEEDQSLKEFLPYVGHIEVQKISMFIKGWRNV